MIIFEHVFSDWYRATCIKCGSKNNDWIGNSKIEVNSYSKGEVPVTSGGLGLLKPMDKPCNNPCCEWSGAK